MAEKSKAHLLSFLQLRDGWKTPLIVNLEDPQANFPEGQSPSFDVSQLGYGLKLQLNLVVTRDLQPDDTRRELLRAILIEMMYRDRKDVSAGTPFVAPPDWLLDGVLALQPGSDRDETGQLLRGFVSQNRIASLQDVVRQKRDHLNPSFRKLYQAYSQALVQLLVDVPGGREKLAHYIRHLPAAPNDSWANLRTYFPEILGRGAGKWWALAVAHLSAADRYELLGAATTAMQLDRLQRFSIAAADGALKEYSLGNYREFSKLPAHRIALERIERQLRLLGARAHPLYQPVVQEEHAVVVMLLHSKSHDLQERLGRIATYRAAADRQRKAIDDYLNWYEATQLKSLSGAFTQTLKTPDEGKPSRRRDPISVYLDSVEMETDL
ncbi:MAG TPA: hypothetical protein VH985_16635 [Candidatus Binatia bacterium]